MRRGARRGVLEGAARRAFTIDAPVANILVEPRREWTAAAYGGSRVAGGEIDWAKFNKDDYLLTQCSIVSSVETEADGHTICTACNNLVNSNGNAWTNDVLLATFRSFVGGQNYLEHCFVAGTRVIMSDGSRRPIESIRAGDLVLNANGFPDLVVNTQSRRSATLVKVHSELFGAAKSVVCTANHPFLVRDITTETEKYVEAGKLDGAEMMLVAPVGGGGRTYHRFLAEAVEQNGDVAVYNFETRDDHSYVVEGAAVHNCQIPALSKGRILDAVIRPVAHVGENGEKANVYMVDLLIATDRRHADLVAKIESGKLTTLSMGCVCNYVTCSKCGGVFEDDESCEHIRNELGQTYFDEQGGERKVAELCGRMVDADGKKVADPESVQFIEASWVEIPAFRGAVLEHFVHGSPDVKAAAAAREHDIAALEDIFRIRVADQTSGMALRVARWAARREKFDLRLDKITNEVSKSFRI